jgi:hypothetical protein
MEDNFKKSTLSTLTEKDEKWKGIMYMLLWGITNSGSLLIGKLIYNRNPKINPEILLFIRGLFATFSTILLVNKNIYSAL